MLPVADRRHALAAGACVAAAAALVYLNTLGHGFALDDGLIVRANPRVHDLADLRAIWLTPYWPNAGPMLGLYRPLTIFVLALQWSAGGGAPWLFHATSIALHAGISALVFALLLRFAPLWPAVAAALLFAVHPVHVEAVANVVGQAELLAAAAVLGAALVHATRPALAPSPRRAALLVALLLAGVLAKESAITLPALLVLLDVAQGRVRPERASVRAYARALAGPLLALGVAIVAWLGVRLIVLGSITGTDAAPAVGYLTGPHRLLMALRAWPEYLRLLVFPNQLAIDYAPGVIRPVTGVTPAVALGFVLLALTLALLARTPWRARPGLAAGWFLLSVLTVSNLFFPAGVLLAERTLYVPSVALAFAAAFALAALASRRGRRAARLAIGATAVAGLLLSLRTLERNRDWKSTMHVLAALARDHPESYRAQWVLAADLWRRGRIAPARARYEEAYRRWPGDSQFLADYASFCFGQREYACAVRLLEEARALQPSLGRYRVLLAQAYMAAGRARAALAELEAAAGLGITRGISPLRGEALWALADYAGSAQAWRAAVTERADAPWLQWAHFARSLAAAGDLAEARSAALRARALLPAHPASERAVARLERAIELGCVTPSAGCPDPLAGWNIVMASAPDSAISSQNARLP